MPLTKGQQELVDRALQREFERIVSEYQSNPRLASYREGKTVNWQGRDRTGFELPEAHLPNAKLARADFTDAVLDRANLRGADLSNAKLVRTSLVAADLTGANLEGADFTGADLADAIGLPAPAPA